MQGVVTPNMLAATIGLFGAAAPAGASTASPVVGYTYIDGNTVTANTIDAFARHADGSVTPLAGAPFAAGVPVPQAHGAALPTASTRPSGVEIVRCFLWGHCVVWGTPSLNQKNVATSSVTV